MVRGPDLELGYANPAMAGLAPLHPELAAHVGAVLDTAEPRDGIVLPAREPGHWLDFTLAPVTDGVLVHAVDVTSLVVTAERTTRLQRVTAALSSALTADEVTRQIVEQAKEATGADAGVIAFRVGDEVAVGPHTGYSDASMERWQRFPLSAQLPLSETMRSGRPVFVSTRADWESRYPSLAPEVLMLGLACVPFAFEDEVLGAMSLSYRDERHFGDDEKAFLEALGRQCAQALERARLYEERAYVARTLQQGLLPESLPAVPGLEVAVRYASIADGGDVGGDFYDLIETDPGRWLAVVGDVCGKGTAAAVLTGLSRHTIRAIAMREPAPAAVLTFLNDALRRHGGQAALCTVVAAALAPSGDGGTDVELACGGHPPPLHLRPGGVEQVAVGGTLLGVDADPELDPVRLMLAPGEALVLYTDGVTDARDASGERFGEERLLAAAAGAAGTAEEIAGALDAAVGAHQRGAPHDDRAILVLRAPA